MKRYDLMHLWEVYGGQLDVEYRQCLEEGLPVETLKPLFDAIGAMPVCEERENMAAELHSLIRKMQVRADYPYREPDDIEAIRALRPEDRPRLPKAQAEGMEKRIENAWLGRVCGCLLGKPVEG